MIVDIHRIADGRWALYLDGNMAPVTPQRSRRGLILLAREASVIDWETYHALLELDAREEAVRV